MREATAEGDKAAIAMPPRLRRIYIGSIAGQLLAIPLLWAAGSIMRVSWDSPAAALCWFGAVVLPVVWGGLRVRSLKRLVQRASYSACPRCLYDLRELPETQPCPECGFAGGRSGACAQWRHAFCRP